MAWGKTLRIRDSLWMIAGAAPVAVCAATNHAPVAAFAATNHAAHQAPNRAQVKLSGDVFVERFEPASGGRKGRVLERADTMHPGDRLVFVVSWTGGDPSGFTVVNPVPRAVAYQPGAYQPGAGTPSEDVSVDGARTWGLLGTLMVHDNDGWRPAMPTDVTHVRWRLPGGAGQITYRGTLR